MIYPLIAATLVVALFAPPVQDAPAPTPATVTRVEATAPCSMSFVAVNGWVTHAVVGGVLVAVDPVEDFGTEPLFLVGPQVIEVSWVTKDGKTVTVKTPCAGYSDEEGCAKAAAKAVAAAEKYYGTPVKKE